MNVDLSEFVRNRSASARRSTASQLLMEGVEVPSRPFRGVLPFRLMDRSIFTGRAEEVRTLLRLICIYRGVLLYGDSGAGKSSLINAGLIPELIDEGFEIERLGVQPVSGEEVVVERIQLSELDEPEALPSLFAAEKARASERKTVSIDTFEDVIVKRLGSQAGVVAAIPRVLIFDQFEELVTQFEDAKSDHTSFSAAKSVQSRIVAALKRLLEQPKLKGKLLFSFREDYFARLAELFPSLPQLKEQALRITSPPTNRLRDIVDKPFETHRFKHALTSQTRDRLVTGFTVLSRNGLVDLTEVQIACASLWEDAGEERSFLAKPDPESAVRSIFEGYVGKAVEKLPSRLHAQAFATLGRLVTPGTATTAGARNIVSESNLFGDLEREDGFSRELVTETLDALCATARLVFRQTRGNTPFYEIVSEFLVPGIASKQAGVEKARQAFEARKLKTEVARQTVRLRLLIGVLMLGLIGLVWLMLLAAKAREMEKIQVKRADVTEQTLLAQEQNAALAFNAEIERKKQQNAEIITTLDAQIRSTEDTLTAKALRSVVSELSDPRVATLDGHSKGITSAAFSGSGDEIITGSLDNRLILWSNRGQKRAIVGDALPSGMVSFARFVRNGWIVAAGKESSEISVFKLDADKQALVLQRKPFQIHQYDIMDFQFSPDGRFSASASADTTAKLLSWENVSSVRELHTWQQTDGKRVTNVAFSGDGFKVAACGEDGRLWVYYAAPPYGRVNDSYVGNPLIVDPNGSISVRAPKFSPRDSNLVVAGAGDRKVVWWRVGSGQISLIRDDDKSGPYHHEGAVLDVAFRPNGTHLATVGTDGLCLIWDVPTSKTVASLATQIQGRLFDVEWQGDYLALVGEDGWVELWNMADPVKPVQYFATKAHNGVASGVLFNPTGSLFLTWSGYVDSYLGKSFPSLPGATGRARRLKFESNERPSDNTAALWDVVAAGRRGWTNH